MSTLTSTSPASTSSAPPESFLRFDGSCGPHPNFLGHSWEWAVFMIMMLVMATGTAITDFVIRKRKRAREHIFTRYLIAQITFSGIFARFIGGLLGYEIFTGNNTDSEDYNTNFRAAAWGAFLGFHPGSLMGILQIFQSSESAHNTFLAPWNAIAVAQILAESFCTWLGLGNIWASEGGYEAPVAVGANRDKIFAAAFMCGAGLIIIWLIFLFYFCYRRGKYEIFAGWGMRILVLFASLALCVGELIFTVIGTSLCGRPFAVSDAATSALQLVLSIVILLFAGKVATIQGAVQGGFPGWAP